MSVFRRVLRRIGIDIVRYPYYASMAGHLQRLLRLHHINVVLDVGANKGQFAEMTRGIGYKGWIVSFEPVKSLYEELSLRAHLEEKWRCFHLALGANDETRSVNILKESSLSSFLAPNSYAKTTFKGNADVERVESAHIITLDSVFAHMVAVESQPRVLLKIDTQGWDLEVLNGARRCAQDIAILLAELSVKSIYAGQPCWADFITRAMEMGFELVGLYPVNQDAAGAIIEFDGIFIRTKSA